MKPAILYLLAMSLVIGGWAGCSPPPPPKPSPIRPLPDGERALRDSLSHTHPQPRR